MKKMLPIIIACMFLQTAVHCMAEGTPWIKYNVGFNLILRGIDFPENQSTIGYLVGETLTYNGSGNVLKTTDGGTTWVSVWSTKGLEGASWTDLNTGYVVGWPSTGAGFSGFGRTTDGGTSWTSPTVSNDVYFLTDVVFKDASNGIIVGQTNTGGGVWYTSNSGTTWTPATGINGIPSHACHTSGNTYYFADNAGHVKRSTDNGHTWTTVLSNGGNLTGIKFLSDSIGMACGDMGQIWKTYDAATTWTMQMVGTDIWHDFGWETPEHLYVCGTPELVFESTDGGSNWQNGFPASQHNAALYECIFTPDGTGFICGSQGTLLKRLPSCIADFTASATNVCTGQNVTYTDLSYGSNLTYHWSFPGGTPSSSTIQNPVVVYNTPGTYNAKLVINNGYISDSLLKSNYITVGQTPATPVISAAGYVLTSSVPNGNQWYRNGAVIPGATSPAYTANQSGEYWDVVIQNSCTSDTSNHITLIMTGVLSYSPQGIILSPNPNNGRFHMAATGLSGEFLSISVYNILGTKVVEKSLPVTGGIVSERIDLGDVPSGIYLIDIKGEQISVVRKIQVVY
jgi:photosystem II stability/assembly factor-like uncharacterized protein